MVQFIRREVSIAVASMVAAVRAALDCKPVRNLLIIAVVADLVALALYIAWAWAAHFHLQHSYFYGNDFYSNHDWSLMERWGYAQELAFTTLLGIMAWRRRSLLFAALCYFALFILLDDSMRIHEQFGDLLVGCCGVPEAISELLANIIDGVIPVLLVILGWLRAGRDQRSAGGAVLLAIAILLFFAVGLDTVHDIMTATIQDYGKIMALIEDGGELLSLTLILTVVTGLFLRVRARMSSETR